MEINKDLIAASSTPIVLAILAEEDSYGYAILQRVREVSSGAMEWTDGMLYPVLHRLERLGLVEARWETAESGRRRKYYRITDRGREQLAEERRQWQAVDYAEPAEELVGATALQDDPLWAEGQLLRQIIETLPYQQRQLVELAFYGGNSHSELAQMLDLPLGTVKTRLRAAIRALREGWMQANAPKRPTSGSLPRGARDVHG